MPNARFLAALCLILSVVWAGTIRAEETPPSAVGRISAASGAISLRPAGGEWVAATLNDPLIAGMAVRTAAPARAALGIGAAQIALSGATELVHRPILRFACIALPFSFSWDARCHRPCPEVYRKRGPRA